MILSDLSKTHARNKQQLGKAITQQNLILNNSIKTQNKLQEYLSVRIYLMLHVAWLETTLGFLLSAYPKQITSSERLQILTEKSQEKMWRKLIEISFRRQYLAKKTSRDLNIVNLGHTAYHRYIYLLSLLDHELTAFIGIRNKLAHGQWAIALNNEGTEKVQDITTKLWTLTKKDCMAVKNFATNFSKIIEMLVASRPKFEATYDTYVNKIEFTKQSHNVSYNWLIEEMKNKYAAYTRLPVKKETNSLAVNAELTDTSQLPKTTQETQ